jgi:hypothetical protein
VNLEEKGRSIFFLDGMYFHLGYSNGILNFVVVKKTKLLMGYMGRDDRFELGNYNFLYYFVYAIRKIY